MLMIVRTMGRAASIDVCVYLVRGDGLIAYWASHLIGHCWAVCIGAWLLVLLRLAPEAERHPV